MCRKRQLLDDGDLCVDVWLADIVEQHTAGAPACGVPPNAIVEAPEPQRRAELDCQPSDSKKKVLTHLPVPILMLS